MKTIAFTNQKGGVGKTTSAVSIAAAAAERGADVLVVDLDSQGSATELLHRGGPPPTGSADVVARRARWSDAAVTVREPGALGPGSGRVDLIAATDGLIGTEEHIYESGDLWALGTVVGSVRKADRYRLCVFDCPPAVSRLSLAAVGGADLVVAPATLSSMTIRGIERLRQLTGTVERALGEAPRVLYLPCAVDARYAETARLLGYLEQAFGRYPDGDLLPAVRTSSAASLSFARGLTALEFRPNGRMARDYRAVLDALVAGGALPAVASSLALVPAAP